MESASKITDCIEMMKSKLEDIKNPLKQNINTVADILDLFERTTSSLLNPIKKLKISYNMRINSFKGKYENVLSSVKSKITNLEKTKNIDDMKNFNNIYIEDTSFQNNEISKEHIKLMRLLEECLESITTLNNLFDTDEFRRLEDKTKNLNSTKKKIVKSPILDLNEDDDKKNEVETKKTKSQLHRSKENNVNNKNYLLKKKNGKRKINNNSRLKTENGHTKTNKNVKQVEAIELAENDITNSFDQENPSISSDNINQTDKKVNSKKSKKSENKTTTQSGINTESINEVGNNLDNGINNGDESDENNKTDGNKDDSKLRKLTDEECLEKMKEKYPNDKGLTKTFITRKLKKRISINRLMDYIDEQSYKNIETTIPKKSGPNSYLKVTMTVCNKDDFSINSGLMYFLRDLFNSYFIIFKEKNSKMKIVIAGHITKDIISFLKKISSEEFRNKYSVQTAKIKAYAFFEELVYEFNKKNNVISKKINDEEITDYINQYNYLTNMRRSYEEIKRIKIDIN